MTMNNKHAKRQRDIKAKLMAAICMLLVSSIMMVSTTYAWFTLSTAPEVTGITTAVGANGNLEMALLPQTGDVNAITAAQGDSMASKTAFYSNTTWGNLVNVSDNASYGLDKITLYPAALNTEQVNSDGTQVDRIKANPLSTPKYGADGRVSELASNTIYGTMDPQRSAFYEGNTQNPGYGVRAIGTASGMTPRNLAYRQALSDASTHAGQAKSVASSTLNANGSMLADVAINHALFSSTEEKPTETYTKEQVDAMRNVVNALLGTDGDNGTTGSLEHIELALKNYIVAYSIADAARENDFATVSEAIMKASLQDLVDGKVSGAVIPAGYADTAEGDGYVTKLNAAITNATTARTELAKCTGDGPFTWTQVSPALNPLVSTSGLLINDMEVNYVMNNKGELAGSVMKNGLILTMGSGSGVFADIADFAGNYSAGIIISELAYGSIVVEDVEATMNTKTTANPVYLTAAATTVGGKAYASVGGGTGANPLTDFYGYVIDLAFRTNVSNSYLQIQQEGIDRIYNNADNKGSNTNTQGGGATMSFTSPSATFSAVSMKKLMKAIRIVFFDTKTGNVITYGRLDVSDPAPYQDSGFTAPIFLCDKTGAAKTNAAGTDHDDSIAIMALEQNTIHQMSVLVYLDGTVVDNAAVAADAAKSLTGSMNLQFSSSANLVAMDYSDLMSGEGGALNGASNPSNPSTPSTPEVTGTITPTVTIDASVTDLTAASVSKVALSDTGFGFTVTGYDAAKHVVAVTINDGTSVPANYVEGTGFACVTSETVESVAISITAKT